MKHNHPKIEIMDTTLRDGEQTSGVSFVPHEKLMIARLLLEDLKADRVEVASARVSEGEFDAVKMICDWAARRNMLPRVEVLGFVDGHTSVDWIHATGCRVINLLCKGSLKHCSCQLKKLPEEHIEDILAVVDYANVQDMEVNVYLEDWSNGMKDSPEYVFQLMDALIRTNIKRYMLPDTLVLLNLAALVSLLVVLAVCFFIEVQQFYRLLGDRGYLMLALPVHAWQHIAAKLICGVVWTLFGFFYFGICGTLTLSALDGDSFSLTCVSIQDVPLLLLFFLLILALIAGAQLHAYLACAYAGMFTQHRLTISIISYFVIGFIGQMLSLVGTIVFAIIVYPSLDNIGSMVELQNGILLSVCVIFLLTLLVDALLWALTQWLMSSRLNLA